MIARPPEPDAGLHAATPSAPALAFKAYEIEELVDIYFFRRLGIVAARAARALSLTPNAVSILAAAVGGIGGVLLATDDFVLAGVLLIYAYGVLDSADGQLARLTGRTSEWGRVLDGVAGYVTHVAAYVAIAVRMAADGSGPRTWALAVGTGFVTVVHAQLYDYHRTTYATIVVSGKATTPSRGLAHARGPLHVYETMQRALAGRHPEVERAIAARAVGGAVSDGDRERYRACFRGQMSGWNLFGDNVRRYAIAICAIAGRLDLFFPAILLLNLPLVVVWQRQQQADARFLGSGPDADAERAIDRGAVRQQRHDHDREP